MDKASESILTLKPVTFHYKKELDPEGIPQFGLVAEEVEKVNPDLVARDAKGEIYTVLRSGFERDVVERVPQRAPRSAGAGSDHHPTKFQIGKAGRDHCAAAQGNGGCHGASPRAGFKNPKR
jgi:hypothetical protein